MARGLLFHRHVTLQPLRPCNLISVALATALDPLNGYALLAEGAERSFGTPAGTVFKRRSAAQTTNPLF